MEEIPNSYTNFVPPVLPFKNVPKLSSFVWTGEKWELQYPAYYQEDSVFRGRWLKVTLVFRGDKEFYINQILTTFNQSFA